jgi:acylphosphatase
MTMKLKIKIAGPKVHEVGYRYFLMTAAIDMGLNGFHARNRMSGTDQEVIALVEGDDEAIKDFKDLIENRKPEHSAVSNIVFEDCDNDVMKTENYAQICSAIQLNKAIPVLLEIRDGVNAVRKTGDETLREIKVMRKTTDATLEEIKGMREEFQPGYASNFRQMQSDIRAIKDQLGMS